MNQKLETNMRGKNTKEKKKLIIIEKRHHLLFFLFFFCQHLKHMQKYLPNKINFIHRR